MDKVSMASSAQEEKSQKIKGFMKKKKKKKGLFPLKASDINECRDGASEVCFVPQLLRC